MGKKIAIKIMLNSLSIKPFVLYTILSIQVLALSFSLVIILHQVINERLANMLLK